MSEYEIDHEITVPSKLFVTVDMNGDWQCEVITPIGHMGLDELSIREQRHIERTVLAHLERVKQKGEAP